MASNNPPDDPARTATDELREGLTHLFRAAQKVARAAEPAVSTALEDAERVVDRLGRGGTVAASQAGREVAAVALRLAEKLRAVASRLEEAAPDVGPQAERKTSTDDPGEPGHKV